MQFVTYDISKAYKLLKHGLEAKAVTDLHISQIGYGLRRRAFRSPAQLLPMTTHY